MKPSEIPYTKTHNQWYLDFTAKLHQISRLCNVVIEKMSNELIDVCSNYSDDPQQIRFKEHLKCTRTTKQKEKD